MAKAIPDRWMDYKPIGERIEGTRFIAFKVPLREHITKTIDKTIRLDGDTLLKGIPNLGMIIDLTNTNRYYDPNFFQKEGVQHQKLMVPGHVTPPKNLVNRFKTFVKNFIEYNIDNDKLIGVHCTHGVNRTGYLICNYMISEMTIDPNEAINRFSNARGHKIERSNYLESLHNLSKDNEQSDNDEDNINQNDKIYNVRNWREHARDDGRNGYSNWRTQGRNSQENTERFRPRTDYYHTRDRFHGNRPMDKYSSYHYQRNQNRDRSRSRERSNNERNNYRLRTDYYNSRPSSSNRRPRTQELQNRYRYHKKSPSPQNL